MNPLPQTRTLLQKATRRKQWAAFGRHFYRASIVLTLCFWISLLVARLTAAFPDVLRPVSLTVIPLGAALIAWFTYRRVAESEAAALLDAHQGNHDLFLTAVHLENSAGDYQDHIRSRSETLAAKGERLAEVIPWRWQKPLGVLSILTLAVLASIQWLPHLDPFGKNEQREWIGKQEQRLEELREENEAAMTAMVPQENAEEKEAIQQALTKLEESFRLAAPKSEDRQELAKNLRDSQRELGKFWKQLNDEKLRDALDQANKQIQAFGESDLSPLSPEAKSLRDQIREMLREGDARELQKKLAEMLEKSEALQGSDQTPAERKEGAQSLQRSLQELADAVAREAPSEQLQKTLQRAIEQMQLAQNQRLADEALQDAQKSMQQMQQQLADLAQQLQQLQELEHALDAAQLAQRLNELGRMPNGGQGSGEGEQGSGGEGMKDYAELYRQLLAQAGGAKGKGSGMRGPGTGEGGVAPEDDSVETTFQDEQSPSHLVAGKTLLEWQTNGVSETGEANKVFRDSISQLKQGLSEAIRQEKVPSGYHSHIQSYFDTLKVSPDDTEGLD